MKPNKVTVVLFLLSLLIRTNLAYNTICKSSQDSIKSDKVYYAIEINGVLCGYFEATEVPIEKEGKILLQQDSKIFAMLSVLGSNFNQTITSQVLLDPETKKSIYIDTEIDQGSSKYNFKIEVADGQAKLKSTLRGEGRTITLQPEILIGNEEVFLKVKNEIVEGKKEEVNYNILEIIEEEIQKSNFKKVGEEKVEFVGRTFNAVIVEQTNTKTGTKVKYWIDPSFESFVKFEVQNRKVYLADRTVIDKIKVADMNAAFFVKTNISIADYTLLSSVKLKAQIEPTGIQIKVDDLNIAGQKFTGTVTNNLIDGIFEIEPIKYDGVNAPQFPHVIKDEKMKRYLEPERYIQSDDPVLIAKAREITADSKDSWEAAKRLSKWVSENIAYAIPGGGTARGTYDIRAGECGGHSMLLASFCRSVGIPARVVFGAMYVPNYGGGFGQHAWNEIYMDGAGWIPVDATAFEIDYVDAGHIRISELTAATMTFNGKKIEILEHQLQGKKNIASAPESKEREKYLGKYSNLDEARTFTVIEMEGNLGVDVPGQLVLPLNPEDENGKWQCKIVPNIYVQFKKDSNGKPTCLVLHQLITLTKKEDAVKTDETVSHEFAPYLGKYFFAQLNADFTVLVDNGQLAVYDPIRKANVKLQKPDSEGGWLDEYNKNTIYFEKDSQGKINAMKINSANRYKRGGLASAEVEKVIDKTGLEAGIEKYYALKETNDPEIFFTEHSLNMLGYKYLNGNKITEAIALFKLNVQEYPESFNVYDSLGEAYMKNNQNDLAAENYRKSLELNPKNENATKMLENLKTK